MQIKRWTCLLGIVFAAVLTSTGAEGPADLLQKGLFEEEANHNLNSAIKAYQSVIQQTDEQRKLGATAIFRLGECYRKLGQTNEALIQYRRVLKEFPEQEKLVQATQRLLTELQRGAAKNASPSAPAAAGFSAMEEGSELQQIQAIAKESPDLLSSVVDNRKSTRLHLAADKGWETVAEFLLNNQADVNALDAQRKTALHRAAAGGHKGIVQLLLSKGAEVNAQDTYGRTALHEAAQRGYKTVVEALLDAKANVNAPNSDGWTPLHLCALSGHKAIAEILIQHKADVNARSTLGTSERGKNNPPGFTPLSAAASADQPGVAELLCRSGAEINTTDKELNTPLHYAARVGALKVMDVLLHSHAKVDVRNKSGMTPLHEILNGTADAKPLNVLIDAGADPNAAAEDGTRPLHLAVGKNNVPQAAALLSAKADPNSTNRYGATALQNAASEASEEMVELLLANKADPNVQDSAGWTALHKVTWRFRNTDPSQPYFPKWASILKDLLSQKADVNIRNNEGMAPLNYFGIPAKPGKVSEEQIIALLKEHGAVDNIPDLPPDLNVIRVWRKGLSRGSVIWTKSSVRENRFTLFETIWSHYSRSPRRDGFAVQGPIPPAYGSAVPLNFQIPTGFRPSANDESFDFPDLSRVTIRRMADGKNYRKFSVNLLKEGAINCDEDMELKFGDVVEIPEKEHSLGAPRAGLEEVLRDGLKECLARHVQLVVKGNAVEMALDPGSGRYLSQALKSPAALKILVSSSDFSQVKVTRKEQNSGKLQSMILNEMPFRNGSNPVSDDLLLQEGDIIEVPEK